MRHAYDNRQRMNRVLLFIPDVRFRIERENQTNKFNSKFLYLRVERLLEALVDLDNLLRTKNKESRATRV